MEQTDNTEFLNKTTETSNGQAETTINVKEEDYKNLQSYSTKVNQERIEYAVKLVTNNKAELLNIKDTKLQNKVIKELYGLENIEELKLIHGENFYKKKDDYSVDEDEEDELTKIKKELTLLKYTQTKGALEQSLDEFKKENKELFNTQGAEEKLREELRFISDSLPVKERINRASKIAFGVSPTDAAYLALREVEIKGGTAKENEIQRAKTVEDEISSIFKRK